MHTDPEDPHGQPLPHLIDMLGLKDGQVQLSVEKTSPEGLNLFYNAADCTINISDAEGFGLATLESMAAETPIIVNMTGGLQDQVTDGEEWFGIGIEPSSKAVIGSQSVPYIYEDRINKDDFINALTKMHNMSKKERQKLGKKCRENVEKRFNFKDFGDRWVSLMTEVHERCGSWDTRKNYKRWEISEI
jgi:glycosyltransferase involved in cell wall biosynthesis